MERDNLDLDKLKEKYKFFRQKYNLPEFSKLNEVFDIEELDVETEFFLRRVRKIICEQIVNYLRFFEVVLNPLSGNVPAFFFKIVKRIDNEDKETLTKIYEKFGNFEIEVVKLDLDYSEEKEAEFIKNVFKIFLDIKEGLLKIVSKMTNSGTGNSKKESGSYFG